MESIGVRELRNNVAAVLRRAAAVITELSRFTPSLGVMDLSTV